jgi:hypothetical protein
VRAPDKKGQTEEATRVARDPSARRPAHEPCRLERGPDARDSASPKGAAKKRGSKKVK